MINIVVPMLGKGNSFFEKGYTFPKPILEINGKPMIQVVVENIKPKKDHKFIFIIRKEHDEKYNLKSLLRVISPGCSTVTIDGETSGSACTAYLAKTYANNGEPLVIANADQFIEGGIDKFLDFASNNGADGTIMTFTSTHPKWSFTKLDEKGQVIEVSEKNPISNKATAGLYYFSKGEDFFRALEEAIIKDARVKGQFFVCPIYNELILKNKIIKIYHLNEGAMHGLGTPEDYEIFLKDSTVDKI